MTRLCVPLTASMCEAMAHDIDVAGQGGAEMVELRLDCLKEWNRDSIGDLMVKARRYDGEVIATCRIADEGGCWEGDESKRIDLLEQAVLNGADYVDLEYATWRSSLDVRERIGKACGFGTSGRHDGCRLILSQHDIDHTPTGLDAMLADLRAEPCDVVKVACKAESIADSLVMLDALRQSSALRPTIALSMGEAGVLTRVLAGKFGAFLTFASLDTDKESAPGQVTLADMCKLYRWDAIGAETALYGVIGCPVAHSMSPVMFNASFDATGHDGVYLPMRVESGYEAFADFVDGCLGRPWLGLRGCSVTIPHKQNLLRYVEERGGEVEPLARRIGAANTLCVEPGEGDDGSDARLSAFNTDYRGALGALLAGLGRIPDERAQQYTFAVLGAGGASRAVVAGLRDCGCEVRIYNRTARKAKALAEAFGGKAFVWDERIDVDADVIVNCTSIGMWPQVDDTPLPASCLSPGLVVFDTIYNPMETRLLREAGARGCKTIDGVEMFVRQAAVQFERWTGQRAPVGVMREAVTATLTA